MYMTHETHEKETFSSPEFLETGVVRAPRKSVRVSVRHPHEHNSGATPDAPRHSHGRSSRKTAAPYNKQGVKKKGREKERLANPNPNPNPILLLLLFVITKVIRYFLEDY